MKILERLDGFLVSGREELPACERFVVNEGAIAAGKRLLKGLGGYDFLRMDYGQQGRIPRNHC